MGSKMKQIEFIHNLKDLFANLHCLVDVNNQQLATTLIENYMKIWEKIFNKPIKVLSFKKHVNSNLLKRRDYTRS